MGQHFLVRGSILERIATAACPQTVPLVIEIGPGKGALTSHLLPRAERIIAIEVDSSLAAALQAKFAGEPRLEIVQADVLQTDLGAWGPAVFAGNLPYYIATPIVEKTVALGPAFEHAVFLVQKEVALRLTAPPGQRDYGYLTASLRMSADARVLFEVKPGAFHPPPKVDSAVVLFTPHARAAELSISHPQQFLEFLSRCFRQKRKTIRNNLLAYYPKVALDPLPEASKRAEQLDLESFARLFGKIVG